MASDGAAHRDDPMRASTPGRLQGGPMLSPGGRNYYVEPIDESPPPNGASGVPSLDVEDDAEGAEEARVWEEYERTMDAETFAFWRDERLDLATSAALADVDGDGVHLMPVTEEGYAGVARLADTIQALASARSS